MKPGILSGLDLRKGWIYEAIISTSSGGKPNAAAMGVRTEDMRTLLIDAYKSSQTCRNLSATRSLTVNFSSDLGMFYDSLYQKEKLIFSRENHAAPYLSGADAYLEAEVVESVDLGDKVQYVCGIKTVRKLKNETVLINRAEALALECLIKASKVSHLDGKERSALIEEIRRISLTVSKVAPGSRAEEMVSLLASRFP